MKKVFIIHGWSGTPESNWFSWMKRELRSQNIFVEVLQMPEADFPKMNDWIGYMHTKIGVPDEDTFLVGHSLGCMAIMRYAESLVESQKIGGILLVAGFSHSIGIPYLEDFFSTPLDYGRVRDSVMKKTFIHSDNDPFVPMSEGELLKNMLGGSLVVLHDAGHVNESGGFVTFAIGLEELLKMMQ
jgi:predicted alpha/beta hydrolase family esterase